VYKAVSALASGIAFHRTVQYHDANSGGAEAPDFSEPVSKDHPYYGGVGYGRHGRPDMSNMSFFLQAMHDAEVSTEDPAYKRALVFLSRVQMNDDTNDMPYADASHQGGFIYATVPNAESIDGRAGQSMAGTIAETTEDGGSITRLRCYGSMTYALLKCFVFAGVPANDPRVVAATEWISAHWTLEVNPGFDPMNDPRGGFQGLYYYYLSVAQALNVAKVDKIITVGGMEHDWRAELASKLISLQQEDGHWINQDAPRWWEGNPDLCTAYALGAMKELLK
jgi:squalene-hopene/tetraprenyl-beta-curcumene cyclase